jgi:hypothetical protein
VAIHEDGWTAEINDPALRSSIQTTMYYTFKDRLDGVVKLLKVRLPTFIHLINSC